MVDISNHFNALCINSIEIRPIYMINRMIPVINPLRTASPHICIIEINKYVTVRKQIIITLPPFTL